MEQYIIQIICTVITGFFASSGFWAYWKSRHIKNDGESEMLRGLAHDRIMFLGMEYLSRGYITQDEYENLNDYLYKPYCKIGGNGSAKHVMERVNNLKLIKSEPIVPPKDQS